ncbi:MAG: AAA family ATPase [Bacteroidota bacterium]
MKKINNIEITNFKSIKHLKINDCNRINVFIGMPNAGKSNTLEALGVFGKITGYNSDDIKPFIRYKIPSELFFEENISKNIEIKINEKTLEILATENYNNSKRNYEHLAEGLKYDNSVLNNPWKLDEEYLSEIKKYIFSEQFFRNSENKLHLDYPFGRNLVQVIVSNPELRKIVNKLFKENNLKLLIEKSSNELKIFKEYQDGTVFTLSYELIADTLQRLIFFKAAVMSNENSVLLFEEPEAHCFEPYILEFTNSVKYDKNDNQFFIVTHSDFIIQEFLRDEESRKNTNIYLVNNVKGETKVKLLNKDKNEDVYELGMNAFFNFETLWENN